MMTIEPYEKRGRRSGGRSRKYPAISLEKAIERAEDVYRAEGRNRAPVSEVVKHWGYSSHTSGAASSTYAAVRQFGLIEEEGRGDERVAQLTDLAFEILRSPDPMRAVGEAALTPPVHREMWENFGAELPSDRTLHWKLQREMGFTETGATEFSKQYRETLAFAIGRGALQESNPDEESASNLQDNGKEWPVETSRPGDTAQAEKPQAGAAAAGVSVASVASGTRIPIPLVGGQQIVIEGKFPITEAAWVNFLAVLQAFKPGLVAPNAASAPADSDTPIP